MSGIDAMLTEIERQIQKAKDMEEPIRVTLKGYTLWVYPTDKVIDVIGRLQTLAEGAN